MKTLELKEIKNDKDDMKICTDNIRVTLKLSFPKIKFSVTRRDYNVIQINWTDSIQQSEVESIVNKFVDHCTDETGDFRDYSPSNFTKKYGGAKYIFCSRNFSDSIKPIFLEWAKELFKQGEKFNCWSEEVLARHFWYRVSIPDNAFKIVKKENASGLYVPETLYELKQVA